MRESNKDSFKALTDLKKDFKPQTRVQIVRNYLRKINSKDSSRRKLPLLNARHNTNRLKLVKDHENWLIQNWRNVQWTDENKIVKYRRKGYRPYVWRPQNLEFNSKFTLESRISVI
ncbi:uncharacterized protein, partial [Drosophila tropicalis]|uniref:uncharacterized protein n=1 Tax=Drosophila tropicalis TaxID=46794 RepID=UPI0035AB70EA